MTIIGNGKRYTEFGFASEKDFEQDIVTSSSMLFGKDTIFINAKQKIEAKFLGGTIPDGFFFDFSDKTDPQFYLVEIETTQHSFFNHIFPQVTKFFAFYKNTKLRKELVDKLYAIVQRDDGLKSAFKANIGRMEIYKFLSDIVESSQNILLIADGAIPELPEISDTYTDTWGKFVKFVEIRKYMSDKDVIYTISPDVEAIQYIEDVSATEPLEEVALNEDDRLKDVTPVVRQIYATIKQLALQQDSQLVFNPQKYYISIRATKNIAFIKFRKNKIRFIVMMPEDRVRSTVMNYPIASLSKPVQDFYNGPCAAVDLADLDHKEDLTAVLSALIAYNRENSKANSSNSLED